METDVSRDHLRVVQFNVKSDLFRNATASRAKRGLALGWGKIIQDGFHTVWPQCSLVMKRNYLSSDTSASTAPYWSAHALCRVNDCIGVKFIVQEKPTFHATTVTVKADITGSYRHLEVNETSGHVVFTDHRSFENGSRHLDSSGDHESDRPLSIEDTSPCSADGNDVENSTSSCFGLNSENLHFETRLLKIKVGIVQGDLTKLKSEAIVNAANSYLRHNGGVAKAIADAAGNDLLTECRRYVNKNGPLHTGEVMHSTPGLLRNRVKFVIHAVGPIFNQTTDHQECLGLLEKTFLNSFIYGNDKLRVTSISIPAISSGIFGVPWTIVGNAAYNAVTSFEAYLASLSHCKRRLMSISFVNNDQAITKHLIGTFTALLDKDHEQTKSSASISSASFECHLNENRLRTSTPRLLEVDEGQQSLSNEDRTNAAEEKQYTEQYSSTIEYSYSLQSNKGHSMTDSDNESCTTVSPKLKLSDIIESNVRNETCTTQEGNEKQTSKTGRKTNFSFTLRYDEYSRIAPQSPYCRLKKPWTDIFYQRFHEHNKQCALVFTYNHCSKFKSRKRGNFWWGRAVCKVDKERCLKVWFTIIEKPQPGQDVNVNVTIRGTCTHVTQEDMERLQPDQPNRRFLTGENRLKVANALKRTIETADTLYQERLAEMDVDELTSGNTTHCQRKQIFRQALYEMGKKERIHDNVIIEIDMLREAWQASLPGSRGISGFIHGVGMFPFYTIMYTEAQVVTYVLACKDDDSVMHLDSTGSVVTDVVGQKRPYYYCLFIGSKKIPAFEFITTRHNATWICSMLEVFGEDAKLLNGRRAVRPRHVVTDFSFALIYAVLNAFNKQTLVEYLSFAYKVLKGQCSLAMITARTFIALCTAHFSKMMSSRLIRLVRDKSSRRVGMVLFTLLMRTVDLQQATLIYNQLHVLLCTKLNTETVKETFLDVIRHIKQTVPDEDDVGGLADGDNEVNKEPSNDADDPFQHESTDTIKRLSPFTNHFAEMLDDMDGADDEIQVRLPNNLYNPTVFKVITDVVHLYPLWAAALHGNVRRFAFEGTKTSADKHQPQCRSNAIVESHFKSVKHGKKICRKLRPRLFLIDRLRSVLAKVNEASIKFPNTRRKRRSARCDDPASTPEVWNRTPKRRRYGDKDVSVRILDDLHQSKMKTSKEWTSEKKLSNKHGQHKGKNKKYTEVFLQQSMNDSNRFSRSISSTSSSGVITFKPFTLMPSASKESVEDDDIVVGEELSIELERRSSSPPSSPPKVTTEVPEELDDMGIQMVQDLLKKHHPDMAGLEYVGFGQFLKNQVPKFSCCEGVPFVQILNVSDHWVCVTNVFSRSTHELYVFDSMQRHRLPDSAIAQISAILRNDTQSETLTVHIRKFVRQPARNRSCGLYAAAAAFACCNREDPTGFFYGLNEMRSAISERVLSDSSSSIPGSRRWPVGDVHVYKTRKVYCLCHKPCREQTRMVQCTQCYHWFHMQCVKNVPANALENTIVPWIGPCCEQLRKPSIANGSQ